jgi:hypothetical protein
MALQDIIDASITGSGANRVGDRIDLGKEVIDLLDTLEIAQSVNGMHLRGRGRATRFRWLGPDDRPVFRFTDSNGCELSDVMVELVNPALTLVQMLDSGTGPVRSSHNILRNIFVPDASGRLGTFWRIGGGADQKNDFMRGENLDVSGCEVGLVVEGRNALNQELYACQFKGRTAGRIGIGTSDGGSVRVFGGALIQFAESAFAIDTRNGVALAAYGVHVENCGRLITAPRPSPSDITTHTVVLDALRWGSPSGEVAADGEIIAYSGGTLVVRGCWFGTGTPGQTVYQFRYDTTQSIGDFVFEDCRVRASNATGHWPGRPPRSVAGSLLYVATSSEPRPMPGVGW